MESVSEKTERASAEETSTNTLVHEKVSAEPSKTEKEETTESTCDATQANPEKLQNGSVLQDEAEEAKKSVVEDNIQNTVLSEDTGLQKDGKDSDVVAPESVIEPRLTKEEENDLTKESVVESKQEITPETESTTADTAEAISKETVVTEENVNIQENEARKEGPIEGIQEVTELLKDKQSEEGDLKESGVQENKVITSTHESPTQSTDDSAEEVQTQIRAEGASSIQDPDRAKGTLIADTDKELGSAQEAAGDTTVNAPEKVSSEPALAESEGKAKDSAQIMDSVQTDNEEVCKASVTKETEIRVLEIQEDMDQKLAECNHKDIQEAKGSEESSREHMDKFPKPNHKLESIADEDVKSSIHIGTDHLAVSHDLLVKNEPDNTTVKQPHEHELSPVPNISISCAESETENKLNNQSSVQSAQRLHPDSTKENDTDSGTGSTADNSSIDLNLSISSFLTKNKESGSISLQVRVNKSKLLLVVCPA